MITLVDVFPIHFDLSQYPLAAYDLQAQNAIEIGGTLAARIRSIKHVPAAWIKTEKLLITPQSFSMQNVLEVVEELWTMELEGFDLVENVTLRNDWSPSAEAISQFVVRGILDFAKSTVKNILSKERFIVRNVIIDRSYELKGIVLHNQPALQITVNSPMSSSQKLKDLYQESSPDSIIDVAVKCKDTKGHVEAIIGELKDHRTRLKRYNPTDYDVTLLDKLPDNHPIISVRPYHKSKPYHYPLGVLDLTVDLPGLRQLGLREPEIKQVTKRLKISPPDRAPLILQVRDGLVGFLKPKYPSVTIGNRYQSDTHSEYFFTSDDIGFSTQLCFGTQLATVSRDTEMLKAISDYGLYSRSKYFDPDNPVMKIGVVDATKYTEQQSRARTEQLSRIVRYLKQLGIEVKRATDLIRVDEDSPSRLRSGLSNSLTQIIKSKPHIILVYLPDSDKNLSIDDPQSLYNSAKALCVREGIASQMIYEGTVSNKWADDNLIVGILGKTGNVPYVLADELEYADLVVGLDVSRRIKSKAAGTMSSAALSRVYTNQGALLGYRAITGIAVEGEIIPQNVLESILPESEFRGKRVVVHRDGRFVGNELESLLNWGEAINAKFYPIEIVKSGASRFYTQEGNIVSQAHKGSIFYVNDKTAYLVSTPPPSGKDGPFSTAIPIEIVNHSGLLLNHALHSVLSLTLLHYGSVRAIRLPVSTHSSDKIAGFLSRNIIPGFIHDDVPFWL